MKKIFGIFVCTLLIATALPITESAMAGDEENPEIRKSDERPFHISTSGITKSIRFDKLFIIHMVMPWPDQMYFSLFGYINYEDGNTMIYNGNTDETVHYNGEHIVLYYNFYGPISSVQSNSVEFEGDAVYATVLGGNR